MNNLFCYKNFKKYGNPVVYACSTRARRQMAKKLMQWSQRKKRRTGFNLETYIKIGTAERGLQVVDWITKDYGAVNLLESNNNKKIQSKLMNT